MGSRHHESRSVEEAARILGRAWSRHALSPRGSGFRLRFRCRRLGEDASISTLSYGAETRVEPGERADVLLLHMPLSGSARIVHADGTAAACGPARYALVDARSLRHATFSADFSALVLRVRRARLHRHLEAALGVHPRRDLALAPEMAAGGPAWAAWAPVAAMLREVGAGGADPGWRLAAALEETAVAGLLLAQPHAYAEALRRPARAAAPRHVRRAIAFVHAHPAARLTADALAAAAGVSVRALFDGFRAFEGVTPAEYVRGVRLEGARAELLAGAARPSEAARRWGFSHPGHFAALYRRRYGEAPGETSARAR
jgi:AraC-like DNA-binding protein